MPSFQSGGARIDNLDVIIKNVTTMGGGARKYLFDVLVRAMQDDVWPLWIAEITLHDHSLIDLRKLGHPYSIRFAKDTLHQDSQIHQQSGNLLTHSKVVQDEGKLTVTLTNNSREYVYLRYGTKTMRMRDPASAVMKKALPLIKARFAREVRNAVIEYMTKG